jgi:6-phosphofructokinase 1
MQGVRFTRDDEAILYSANLADVEAELARGERPAQIEVAGPRERIFFDPPRTTCGIVTCGGLCPGINDVIRAVVLSLHHHYGVRRIYGFRYGYQGLVRDQGLEPVELTPASVSRINESGGTILGSSRGPQDPADMVESLVALGVDLLIAIGGDGTLKGARAIAEEARRRGLEIAVVGVPKTIDNDIHFIDRSFGFESAYSAAVEVVRSARVEAMGAHNGIGLVKLMGRHSGFVACQAALASADVDLVLIPEIEAHLEGERGVLGNLDRVLARKGHAVVVVAEGAAQELMDDEAAEGGTDKSGNTKLKDIGVFMRERITDHYKRAGKEVTLKYIDPSYMIRSVRATPSDSVYCWNMARNAVHAAMAGNTEMLIGRWHGRFVHVPMALATRNRKRVDTTADLWMSVIEATGQPRSFA